MVLFWCWMYFLFALLDVDYSITIIIMIIIFTVIGEGYLYSPRDDADIILPVSVFISGVHLTLGK